MTPDRHDQESREVEELLSELDAPTPPPSLRPRILAALEREPLPRRRRIAAPALVAAAALVAIWGASQFGDPIPTTVRPDPSPTPAIEQRPASKGLPALPRQPKAITDARREARNLGDSLIGGLAGAFRPFVPRAQDDAKREG